MKPSRCAGACLLTLAVLLPLRAESTPDTKGADETVVLLHGLWRSERSMRMFERALSEDGYDVHNIGYPSVDAPLSELSNLVAEKVARCCADDGARLHFVTHSMGGIVLRTFLAGERRPANLGRVVMLAPPNAGSELADGLQGMESIRGFAGPAALDLGTGPEDAPQRLGPVDFELGVLIGNWSSSPVRSWLIPGDDDGTVAVASARIAGMRDFRILPATHTWILRSRRALAEVRHFLSNGSFRPEAD